MPTDYFEINSWAIFSEYCLTSCDFIFRQFLGVKTFSNCSVSDFQRFTLNVGVDCLLNKPQIQERAVCGNRIKEGAKACDCGNVYISLITRKSINKYILCSSFFICLKYEWAPCRLLTASELIWNFYEKILSRFWVAEFEWVSNVLQNLLVMDIKKTRISF